MKKLWKSNKLPLIIFVVWRLSLFVVAFLGVLLIRDFGRTFPYANTVLQPTGLPSWIWGFGNFDGVHYLRLAQNGYVDAYYQAFFPLLPLLIRFFNIIPKNVLLDARVFVDPSYFYTGIILSNLFLLISLLVLNKLVGKNMFFGSALLLLSFPTAFYFGAIYTESLFLLELLLFMLFLKEKKYLYAGCVASVASATRLIGVLLSLVLLIELIREIYSGKIKLWTTTFYKEVFSLLVAPSGLLAYMFCLKRHFGNYFAFVSVQSGFGAERSSMPMISLPQVFYRYLKMFLSVKNQYQLFSISVEFVFAILGLVLIIWAYKKIAISWWLFSLLVYLLPTLTGTFSSMPRYLIFSYVVLIPIIVKLPASFRKFTVVVMSVLQMLFLALFTRGYWVA